MSGKVDDEPAQDPYDLLGVPFGASDAVITKAYRKLALKLHPDKQQNLSKLEQERVAQHFHDIQQARAFLLDHVEARRKYDAKRASKQARQQADAARDVAMSERRKRMRNELAQEEERAKRSSGAAAAAVTTRNKPSRDDARHVDHLRRQGQEMREQAAAKAAAAKVSDKVERQQAKDVLLERQVRLKWSRKKVSVSPSEHSLVALMSRFGAVEHVEMLGSKGNAALITFTSASSCDLAVEGFATSDEMRASLVSETRRARTQGMDAMVPNNSSERSQQASRDAENVQDWKLRQAAERERLLREMQTDEDRGVGNDRSTTTPAAAAAAAAAFHNNPPDGLSNFPPDFPVEYQRLTTPFEMLERAQHDVFAAILTPDQIAELEA